MSTSRFTNGITTASQQDPMGQFILPDNTKAHVFWEDFDYYVANDWTVTVTADGTSAASQALTDGDGGLLLLTNDIADNDNIFYNKVGESFLFETNKKTWFEARFKVSDATQSDVVVGLQITDTSPLAVTDGVFFLKADGSTSFSFLVEKDSTATTTSSVATIADDTFIRLSFYYDGASAIKIFADGVHVGTSVTTNLPDDEELTVSFGIQNGEAASKTMTVDYVLAAKER